MPLSDIFNISTQQMFHKLKFSNEKLYVFFDDSDTDAILLQDSCPWTSAEFYSEERTDVLVMHNEATSL